jgi:hypothetical protein
MEEDLGLAAAQAASPVAENGPIKGVANSMQQLSSSQPISVVPETTTPLPSDVLWQSIADKLRPSTDGHAKHDIPGMWLVSMDTVIVLIITMFNFLMPKLPNTPLPVNPPSDLTPTSTPSPISCSDLPEYLLQNYNYSSPSIVADECGEGQQFSDSVQQRDIVSGWDIGGKLGRWILREEKTVLQFLK